VADGGDNEPPDDREGLVRRQVILTVRCVIDVPNFLDEDGVRFFVEEQLCKSDLVMSLAEQIAHDDEIGECNMCINASATVVPLSAEVQSAWLDSLPSPMPAPFRMGGDEDETPADVDDVDEDEETLDDDEEGDEEEDGEEQP
jgi:hypothetical protein